MKEVWKQYKDTKYSVSNTGKVRNDKNFRLLKPTRSRQGYLRLAIWHEGKSKTVALHRIIAETFLENPENKAIVNHLDGDKSNNNLDNLEWSTISENVKHAFDTGLSARGEDSKISKLTEAEVLTIISRVSKGNTIAKTAKEFNISAAAVSHIWNGTTWKHLVREKPHTKNYRGKLKASDIPVIRAMFIEGKTNSEIAKIYGINRASVYNIRHGKNWKNY